MPTQAQVPAIIARVQQLIHDVRPQGVHLHLAGQRFEDDWLYLTVEPTQANERASQHARFMTAVERQLLQEGYDQVLIVPAVPEHAGLVDIQAP